MSTLAGDVTSAPLNLELLLSQWRRSPEWWRWLEGWEASGEAPRMGPPLPHGSQKHAADSTPTPSPLPAVLSAACRTAVEPRRTEEESAKEKAPRLFLKARNGTSPLCLWRPNVCPCAVRPVTPSQKEGVFCSHSVHHTKHVQFPGVILHSCFHSFLKYLLSFPLCKALPTHQP